MSFLPFLPCRLSLSLGLFSGLMLLAASLPPLQPLQAVQLEEMRWDYNGSFRARAFYLERDLLLPASSLLQEASQPAPGSPEEEFCSDSPDICETSTEQESQDYLDLRLRLDLRLQASSLVDLAYALEVGNLIFGREENLYGPGSGGRGSGRTNVETRELYMDIHNDYRSFQDRLLLRLGIFYYNTPEGIVMARSGAGLQAGWERSRLRSVFELLYFREIDNSWIDGDSNGFSDDNFADIHLALFSWSFAPIHALDLELYSLYRQDSSSEQDSPSEEEPEISQVYWAGLYLELQYGRFDLILHAIANWGHFLRSSSENAILADLEAGAEDNGDNGGNEGNGDNEDNEDSEQLRSFLEERLEPQLDQRYDIQAGAGRAELRFRATRKLSLALLYAHGSGHLAGTEGSGAEEAQFRRDQFRSAGAQYQLSEIAVDSSGGFSIFPDGELVGLRAWGLICSLPGLYLFPKLKLTLGYFRFENYRPEEGIGRMLGSESNAKAVYLFDLRLSLKAHLALFEARDAYRHLYNTEGRHIFESQLSLEQRF